jgi:hypothetical protein
MSINRIREFLPPEDDPGPPEAPTSDPAQEDEEQGPGDDGGPRGAGDSPCLDCPNIHAWGSLANRFLVQRAIMKDGSPIIIFEIQEGDQRLAYGLSLGAAGHVAGSIECLIDGHRERDGDGA